MICLLLVVVIVAVVIAIAAVVVVVIIIVVIVAVVVVMFLSTYLFLQVVYRRQERALVPFCHSYTPCNDLKIVTQSDIGYK